MTVATGRGARNGVPFCELRALDALITLQRGAPSLALADRQSCRGVRPEPEKPWQAARRAEHRPQRQRDSAGLALGATPAPAT